MNLTKEQIKMLASSEKSKTNGPIPMTPTEAEKAAETQDRVDVWEHEQAVQQAIFSWRLRVESAQRRRQTSITKELYRIDDDVDAEIVGLNVVRQDLINVGWHVHTKVKPVMLGHELVLLWSTRPITWWDKLWM